VYEFPFFFRDSGWFPAENVIQFEARIGWSVQEVGRPTTEDLPLPNKSQKSKAFVKDIALDNGIGGRTGIQNLEVEETECRERCLKVVIQKSAINQGDKKVEKVVGRLGLLQSET
jgi:hypothetical protein